MGNRRETLIGFWTSLKFTTVRVTYHWQLEVMEQQKLLSERRIGRLDLLREGDT
jgi:hypothetical protein